MNIAFVSQPIDTVLPPFQNSVGACTYGAACALAKSSDVTVFGLHDRQNPGSDVVDRGVRFRFLHYSPRDWLLYRLRDNISKFVQMSEPASNSQWMFPVYGQDVARALARTAFDVIHIQHCSQYVPVIRALNPRAKIVLQLQAEWFSQSIPARLATRLTGLDLLAGASDYVTRKTMRDLPSLADRCETVYDGIDADEFAAPKDYRPSAARKVKRLLYSGRCFTAQRHPRPPRRIRNCRCHVSRCPARHRRPAWNVSG